MTIQFSEDVQEQFRKAGWYPGRDVRERFEDLTGFDSFPAFLKEFLYEYGDLEVPCFDPGDIGLTGILNLKALPLGYFMMEQYLGEERSYGTELKTFPFGDYHLDAAAVECDADGRVYMASDFPNMMSDNFRDGIERIIREDYSETLAWDEEAKVWR